MRAVVMDRPPRHVLMTTDAVGGVWTYALDLAEGLSTAGIRTTLAVLGPPPVDDQVRQASAIEGLDLLSTGLPLDWTAPTAEALGRTASSLQALARRLDVDLVHLNAPALAGAAAFEQPVVSVSHSCLATWWSSVRSGPPPEDFRWRIQAHWRGLLASDAVIAPSNAFAEDTRRAYETVRPFVVHNGRRAEVGTEAAKRDRVVTSGRLWDDGKDLATLDRAAARLATPIHAFGPIEGPHGERRNLAHAEAAGRRSSEAIRTELQRAAIYVSASVYEPFGLGVLEAAQAGCALVLSDIPTFRELWQGAAMFAPPGDDQAFARAIQALCDEPDRRDTLAAAALQRSGRYCVEAMTRGVLDVYASLSPSVRAPSREVAA